MVLSLKKSTETTLPLPFIYKSAFVLLFFFCLISFNKYSNLKYWAYSYPGIIFGHRKNEVNEHLRTLHNEERSDYIGHIGVLG
jgi:hypothetical protein